MVRRERVLDRQLPRGQLGMCVWGGKGDPTHPTRTPVHVRIRPAAPQCPGGVDRGAEQQVLQPGRGGEKGTEMAGLGQAPCGGTSGKRVPAWPREAGRGVEKGKWDRGTLLHGGGHHPLLQLQRVLVGVRALLGPGVGGEAQAVSSPPKLWLGEAVPWQPQEVVSSGSTAVLHHFLLPPGKDKNPKTRCMGWETQSRAEAMALREPRSHREGVPEHVPHLKSFAVLAYVPSCPLDVTASSLPPVVTPDSTLSLLQGERKEPLSRSREEQPNPWLLVALTAPRRMWDSRG